MATYVAFGKPLTPSLDLVAVNLDQKQPGFPANGLPDYLSHIGVPFPIKEQDTYPIVTP